jgi:hypothetical protein
VSPDFIEGVSPIFSVGWEGPAKKGIALRRKTLCRAARKDGRPTIILENIC